jgi:hypothetical protein
MVIRLFLEWYINRNTHLSYFHEINANFSDKITLLGYEINKRKFHPKDTLCIVWQWKCTEKIVDSCFIWVSFVNRWGTPILTIDRKINPQLNKPLIDTCKFLWPEGEKGRYVIVILGGLYFIKNRFYHLKVKPTSNVKLYRKKYLVIGRFDVR